MKRRFLIPLLLLPAACGGSNEPPASTASAPPPTTVAAAPSPSPLGPSIVVEVVTIDTAAPSITLREGDVPAGAAKASNLKPGDRTLRVESSAAASLSGIKPGMRVRVTCSAPPAVVVESSPAAGAAKAPPAPPAGPLAGCDSIVAIAPQEALAP